MLPAVRSTLKALSPRVFPYTRFALALAAGAAGGYAFLHLNLPLPWMLGSMTVCTIASVLQAPVEAPKIVRPPMTMVIGVLLGSGFSPDIVARLPGWIPTLIGLALFMCACGLLCVTYFRKVGGLDLPTAFFSGMPGGLVEMVVIGEDQGADARTIALLHSARILLLVLTLPFLIQWAGGVSFGPRSRIGESVLDAPFRNELWLVAIAVGGSLLGYLLRLRPPFLLGPMLLSAGVHLTGLTSFVPAAEIVNGAQLVLGTTIGCSFAGVPWRTVLRVLGLSVGSTAILLALTLAFAFAASHVSTYGPVPLMLAYSPGGLAEMSLIGLALQIEVAFIAGHHIARVLMVVTIARPVFRFFGSARGG